MEPVYYILAIMGCADESAACRQARVEPVQFRTVQQCQAAMPAALERNTDLLYPTLTAACRASGPRFADNAQRPQG